MKDLPEAPASATLSVVTPKGYNTLFTLREMDGETLLKKIGALENKLEDLGYKPQVKPVFGAKRETEYVENKSCPVDGGRLKVIHAKDGKTYWACENGKYDPVTKQKSGCMFFTSPEQYEQKAAQAVTNGMDF